ncbi:hypothetical protein [Pseudoalteromonas piscicida]|nr:hypothetical protein [Pseudoalteromonas piscicida]
MSNSPCEICGYEHADSYAIYTMPIELCDVAQQEYDIWLCCDCIEMCEKRVSKIRSQKESPLSDEEFVLLSRAAICGCDEWLEKASLSIVDQEGYAVTKAQIDKVNKVLARLANLWGKNAN